jgi:glycine cleavage system H protein
VKAGDRFSEVESTKSVSDIYAPISGTIVDVNADLADEPQRINEDPYGDGWICIIRPADASEVEGLLDAPAYQALVDG